MSIYTFNAETFQFIDVSHGACSNLGYTIDELRQLTPVDLKPEFSHEHFTTLIDSLLSGEKQIITFETKHQRKNGSCYQVEVRLLF